MFNVKIRIQILLQIILDLKSLVEKENECLFCHLWDVQ